MKDITEPKHVFEIPPHAIKKKFDDSDLTDSVEQCVEHVHFMICQTFGSDDFEMQIDWDTSHDNPYFHNVCCVVTGIDSATAGLVKNDLIKQGLID